MTDLSALLESVASAPRGRTVTTKPCKVSDLGLADTVATLSQQAASTTVARVVLRLGHRLTSNTILRHTRGECGCPK